MKRLVIAVLALALSLPIPAEGFFNRDCDNLKKRTLVNQKRYERAWNTYQTTLANWINANKDDFGRLAITAGPVKNRFMQVADRQLVIARDFIKYPKCVRSPAPGGWTAFSGEISRFSANVAYTDLYFNVYFKTVFDYTRFLR